ncbi:hypothetical protein HYC85_005998 [Camellia sinensis]|uniref:Uncharacterized protein n=1 Tax=Camellia sinensis TaxID=4442 RepID=A0A7J7I125_CAMSI|nr:hypothetical protein HYC85_005998 [Camellia sinensis]
MEKGDRLGHNGEGEGRTLSDEEVVLFTVELRVVGLGCDNGDGEQGRDGGGVGLLMEGSSNERAYMVVGDGGGCRQRQCCIHWR